jgi:hypothetical protein
VQESPTEPDTESVTHWLLVPTTAQCVPPAQSLSELQCLMLLEQPLAPAMTTMLRAASNPCMKPPSTHFAEGNSRGQSGRLDYDTVSLE